MENIQVALRIRPLNKYETRRSEEYVWYTSDNRNVSIPNSHYKELVLAKRLNPNTKTNFCFDYCFTPEDENNTVYEKLVRRIALSSLKGINGTVFMYGQTGSGKTYTMMGYDEPEAQEMSYSRSGSPIGRRSPTKRYPQSPNASMFSYESPSPGKHKRSADFQTAAEAETQEIYNRDLNENTGILILALKELFKTIENDLEKTYFLRCSYVEIYNDQVYDLLKDTNRLGEVLSVNEGAQKEFYIKGVTEEPVSSIDDILEKLTLKGLRRGEAHRHYASTIMNHVSSRSHTIFRLMVQTVSSSFIKDYRGQQQQDDLCNTSNINNQELRMHIEAHLQAKTGQKTVITESLLNFVDLAGSEKVSNHHQLFEENEIIPDAYLANNMVRDRIKEGQHINKSLFFLTQVISLKSEGKSVQHIPYRNSPLTKILRSSLGGNSRTLIILCANPTGSQVEQTLSTLRFGMNAKKIENQVQANITTNDEGNMFKLLITDYERKLRDLESLRGEDQSRISELLNTVADLSSQRSALQEKIDNLCKLQIKRMASGNIPADELALFFKQARERNIHFDDVGILFSAKGIKKYERKSSWDDEDEKNQTLEGKNRAQEMLNLCNIAKLRMTNQEIELLRKKITTLQENFEGLSARNIGNYEQYLNIQEEGKFLRHELNEKWKGSQKKLFDEYEKIKEKLEKLAGDFNQQLEVNNDLTSTLELFRDMIGITELSDENLLSIEKHLWAKIDDVKTEKARRVFEKETGHSIRKEAEVKRKPLNKLVLSLNELDESLIAELETETSLLEEDKLKSVRILREKGEFNEIFNTGITEINEELENCLKFSFEAEGLLKRDNEILLTNRENIELGKMRADAVQEFMESNPCFKLDFTEKLDEFDLRAMFEDKKASSSESKGGSGSSNILIQEQEEIQNQQETPNKIKCIDNDYTIEQESFDGLHLIDSGYNSLVPLQQIPSPERAAKVESLEYSEEDIEEDIDAGVDDLSKEVAQSIFNVELSRSQTPTRGGVSAYNKGKYSSVTPTQRNSINEGGFKKAATKVVSQVKAAWGSNKKPVNVSSTGKIDTMKSKSKPNSREGSISTTPKKLTGSKSHKQLVLPGKEENRNHHYSPVFGGNMNSAKGFGSVQKKDDDVKINMKRFIESGRSSLNSNNKTLDLEVHLQNARKLMGQRTVDYEKKQGGDFMQVAQEIYKHQYSKSMVGSQPQQHSTVMNSFFEDNKPGFDISEIKMKDNGSDRYQSEAYLRSFNSSMLDVDDKLEISGLGNNILSGDGGRKRRTREERMKNKALSKGGY